MKIQIVDDRSVAFAPSGFVTALNQAVQYLDQTFTAAITITIDVGWGEIGGTRLPAGVTGEGSPDNGQLYSYSQLKSALLNNINSSADAAALATLPASDPTGGGSFYVGGAEEKALGLISPTASGTDGEVGFQGDVGEGTILHELTHTMGRVADLGEASNFGYFSPLDLFRYTAPGVLAPTALNGAYLSADGGQSAINTFDSTSDPGDWAGATSDAFNAFGGPNDPVSAGDIETMNLLGFSSAPLATTTAELIWQNTANGNLLAYDVGANALVLTAPLGQVPLSWQFAGVGDFSTNAGETDLLVRDANSGQVDYFDIQKDHVASVGVLSQIALSWQFEGFGDFSGNANETDMVIRNTNSGQVDYFDIQQNKVTSTGVLSQIPLSWQFIGSGDFSSNAGETDMLIRDSNSGQIDYLDIVHNQLVSLGILTQIGPQWEVAGFGDFSGNANETDMLIRDTTSGQIDYFDIQHNQVTAAGALGQLGTQWQFVGFGDISGNANETDMLARDTKSGQIDYFDIQNNRISSVGVIGTLPTTWQFAGIGT